MDLIACAFRFHFQLSFVRVGAGFGLIMMEKGSEGHTLHGSSGPGFDPHQYYVFKGGKMHTGLTVVAWQFADVNPGDGGRELPCRGTDSVVVVPLPGCVNWERCHLVACAVAVIPGSHKGNYSWYVCLLFLYVAS